jgi:hypothetical protein
MMAPIASYLEDTSRVQTKQTDFDAGLPRRNLYKTLLKFERLDKNYMQISLDKTRCLG